MRLLRWDRGVPADTGSSHSSSRDALAAESLHVVHVSVRDMAEASGPSAERTGTSSAPGCALSTDQEDARSWAVSVLVILLLESVELLP